MVDPVDSSSVVDLGVSRSIHLVGVGGSGISAIAVILATMGHRISGADVRETPAWPVLAAAGVNLTVAPASELFIAPAGTEVVAHSTAFPPGPADLAAAERDARQVVDRAQILAAICRTRATVAVSGTHGKTSTTAMLATLLDTAGADPSFLVGAVPVGLGAAARWTGEGDHFVVEADESDSSFLALDAEIAVVTNIDEDHLDHWGDIDAIEAGFDRFVANARRSVVCIDDPWRPGEAEVRAERVARARGAVTVGEVPSADWVIHDVEIDRLTTRFGLVVGGQEVGPVEIGTPGRHHARNAATALAAAHLMGVEPSEAVAAVGAYSGVSRRFEVLGRAGGVTVVDDYAHNPGKVHALVSSAVEAGWDRVVAVFQPHRYTRTRDQAADFGAALASADLIAVTDVYAAGESPIPDVSGLHIVESVLDQRPWASVAWLPDLDDVVSWASARLRPGDLCLTIGAGDVSDLGPRLLAALGGHDDGAGTT